MNKSDKTNGGNANDDKLNNDVINDLYQASTKGSGNEQPPVALDQLIKNAAQDSLKPKQIKTKGNNRTMWMAAASVAMVVPLLYWLTLTVQPTEMQQGTDYFPQAEMNPVAAPKADKKVAAKRKAAQPLEALSDSMYKDQQNMPEQGKITVTGSRIMREPEADDETYYEADIAEEAQLGEAVAEPAPILSLERNRALLKSEFKAKKQRIHKDSFADPMMALEWQQLNQYIEEGKKQQAQALLATMRVDWPNYDFTSLTEQIKNME